jgi:hypothetical protein
MNAKRTQKSSTAPEPDPNPAWSANEVQIAERTAEAVAGAKRSDSDVRAANAHLRPEDVT